MHDQLANFIRHLAANTQRDADAFAAMREMYRRYTTLDFFTQLSALPLDTPIDTAEFGNRTPRYVIDTMTAIGAVIQLLDGGSPATGNYAASFDRMLTTP